MKCLIAIIGPTAVGKSGLAMRIAKKTGGEIINADSRQIYRCMDIGTAKPSKEDRLAVPHHLLDIIFPSESYSVALYQRDATRIINKLHENDKLPMLVGGSGQYVWSVIEGWKIPEVKPDYVFRKMLENRASIDGVAGLHAELGAIDDDAARQIPPTNVRRIIRALEIYKQTGIKPSTLRGKSGLPYPVLMIGLTAERQLLYSLIDKRTDKMIEMGLIEEVRKLMQCGYHPDLSSMSSLGYREISMYVSGKINLEDAVQRIKYETHRFARAQYTWFRLNDSRIKWLNISNDIDIEIDYTIKTFRQSNQLL